MQFLQLFILLTGPGLYFYSLLNGDIRDRLNIIARWSFITGVSIVFTSLISILTLYLGFFWLDLIVFTYFLGMLLVVIHKPWLMKHLFSAPVPSFHKLMSFCALSFIIIFLFFQPTEHYFGGRDPGIYVHTAIHISQANDIKKEDRFLTSIRNDYPGLFKDRFHRFAGIYLEEHDGALFTNPQYYHVYSIWLAMAHKLWGADWFLYITPLFGLLSLMMFFSFTHLVFDKVVSTLAVLFLSFNISQIWYARGPYSEILSQLVIWLSLFLIVLSYRHQNNLLAFLSGLSLGVSVLIRLDNILLLGPYMAFLTIIYILSKNKYSHFILCNLAGLSAAGLVYLMYVFKYGREYTTWALIRTTPITNIKLGFFFAWTAGTILVLLVFVLLFRTCLYRALQFLIRHKSVLLNVLLMLLLLYFGYLYFIRPDPANPAMINPTARSFEEEAFVRLGWYLSEIGIILSVLGLFYFIRKRINRENLIFVLFILVNFTIYLYNPRIYPDHFWAVRRYVPFIIPAFLIFISYILAIFYRGSLKLKILSGLLTTYIFGYFLFIGWPFLYHTEYGGIKTTLDSLASRFGENDIIITNKLQFLVGRVGTPLYFMYNKQILFLKRDYDQKKLARFVKDKSEAEYKVFMLLGSDKFDFDKNDLYLKYLDQVTFQYNKSADNFLALPDKVALNSLRVNIYRCLPKSALGVINKVDLGSLEDFNYTLHGFFYSEGDQEVNYRWTRAQAEIGLAQERIPAQKMRVLFRAAHHGHEADKALDIFINGQKISTMIIGHDFADYGVEYSVNENGPAAEIILSTIGFKTDGWRPIDLGLGRDKRELGIQLDWLKFEY
ncbi:hypothetical protein ACFL27_18410 [candidate division CSSED10-310 bacterium]|uniref:Glycosyltransferase RgtA/B/C/D-like domain-containing protein n=1 Tax=candidate division CSSED10-310 bacterium TaxID=2855610 RepID=A0ABV6Z134_UNCC1